MKARIMQPAHESAVLALAEGYLAEEAAAQVVAACELTAEEALLMFHSRLVAAQQAGLAVVLLDGSDGGDDHGSDGDDDEGGRVSGLLLALTYHELPDVPHGAALVSDAYVVPEARRGANAYPLWRTLCEATREAGLTHLYVSTRVARLHTLLRKLRFQPHAGLAVDEPGATWFRLTLATPRNEVGE